MTIRHWLFALWLLPTQVLAQDREATIRAVDSIVSDALEGGRAAGMAVAVVQGSDTLVLRGYGKADLEWNVPTSTDAMFEIGSVTKQFTAAAILQLVEQGKLDLAADITTWLPDYPTAGHRIPLRRLLDHTSGIKGYTEMAVFRTLAMQKLSRDTLVKLVGAEPFDFAPGEALVYNNSGYFLLGLIIEKVTGEPYERYIEEKLFKPLGMTRSRYCSENAVVERRAHGYDFRPTGLVRTAYLDHTWPYAAGSLCSSAGDLVTWQRALHGGRVVGADSYREMLTPARLNDGTVLRYATGLMVDPVAGHRAISHGGGINGFLSEAVWFPETDTHIVVLVNTAGPVSPSALTERIATAVLGKGSEEPAAPYTGDLGTLTGDYEGPGRGRRLELTVLVENDTLKVRAFNSGQASALRHVGNGTFVAGGRRLTFRTGGSEVTLLADFGSVGSLLRRKTGG